ncbi:MAG TPA: bifunctional hydroxymethylpyrimidine kinase/phosphomethylpyrimidine kinase [Syntrophaceae bacterium]|jgi:hydroxymethylpyrimidine/phosphomethylpyrimidine kinase|nr:bifunctional hydroxymethylpyrimidine kinase/phosphomethylpyrimidine kinase [Syntrophaceae bacterium]
MKIVRVLSIAGSDSSGGAGIQADLKTITALGAFGMSVVTALTAQNSLGVQGIYEVPTDFVEKQITSVLTDIGVDAIKTGMLTTTETLTAVAGLIRKYGIEKLVVDPVMAAKGGEALIKGEVKKTLIRELIPLCFIVTPNIPEAEILAEIKISDIHDMESAAKIIHTHGAKNVLVKGGHLTGDTAVDILFDGKQFHAFSATRIDMGETHGTGCTYSAAIATLLAKGQNITEAVKGAKAYITGAIRHAYSMGTGYRLINHLAPVLPDE